MRLASMFLLTRYALMASARRTDSLWLYPELPIGSVWPIAMITSSVVPPSLPTRSSIRALPAGFSTDLSKSNSTSAANVTFSVTGLGAGLAAGLTGAGAGAAGGGGAAAGFAAGGKHTSRGIRSGSHSQWASAGVQVLLRQQRL